MFFRDNELCSSNKDLQRARWKEAERSESNQIQAKKRKRLSDDGSISSHHSSPHIRMSPRSPRLGSPRIGSPRGGALSPRSSPSFSQKAKGAQPLSPRSPLSDWPDAQLSGVPPGRVSDSGWESMSHEHGRRNASIFTQGHHGEVGSQGYQNRARHPEHGRVSTSALGYPQLRHRPPSPPVLLHGPKRPELTRSHSVPTGHEQLNHPDYRHQSSVNTTSRYSDLRCHPSSPSKGFKELENMPELIPTPPPPPPPRCQEKVSLLGTSHIIATDFSWDSLKADKLLAKFHFKYFNNKFLT